MHPLKPPPRVAILVDTSTGWGRGLIRGVLNYMGKHGPWDLLVRAKGQDERIALPEGWTGDGIIARVSSRAVARDLARLDIPVVNVSGIDLGDAAPRFPRVASDYDAIARLAAKHFTDRGFSAFGYSGPSQLAYVERHREAFRREVERSGHQLHVFRPARSVDGEQRYGLAVEALGEWLEELPKPAAIFTWGTERGLQVLEACRTRGIAVPHEAAVLAGEHDDLLCDASVPPLSAILSAAEQIGHAAAATLGHLLHGERPERDPNLIEPVGIIENPSTDTLAVHDADVMQAIRFIRERAFDPIQIADILRAVPVSRRTLERKFQATLGRTPADEIRQLRLARARTLLAQTDLDLAAIAEACGYATYNHLSVLFKREYGAPPREFRTRVRGR